MSDRILLRGLAFYGYHGVRPEEQHLGQRFLVDLDLWLDLAPAGRNDDVGQSVDYGEAHRLARDVVEGPGQQTLEAVAEKLAATLLGAFARLDAVTVRVQKPGAPIAGAQFRTVAVEITRPAPGGERA